MKPIITVHNLSFTYPGNEKPSLSDVSFQIRKGETVLVCGESGSGKSSLLYCMNGLIPHVFNGELSGSVHVDGCSPGEISLKDLSRRIGTVFQNVDNQLFMLKVYEDVAFGCENLSMDADDIHANVCLSLKAMGIFDLKDAEISRLSGGEKQRTAVCGVLAMGPDILLFDEPLAEQDETGRTAFVAALKKLQLYGCTILIVEHQVDELIECADRVLMLEKGELVEKAYQPPPVSVSPVRLESSNGANSIIQTSALSYKYNNDSWIFNNLDFDVKKGEFTAIVGPNGSGKTTLFKLLTGLIRPIEGTIIINGIRNPSMKDLVGRLALLYQNPDEQLFTESVEDEVLFGPRLLGKKESIDKYLNVVSLEKYRKRHPFTLSRGERQRLAISSILSMEPEIIILDEPATGLDSNNWIRVMDIMNELNQSGTTVLFSSHNKEVIRRYAKRVINLDCGY